MILFHPLDIVRAVVLRALSTQIKSSAVAQLKKLCMFKNSFEHIFSTLHMNEYNEHIL